ncbi:hypothetical protein Tco_1184997 [Tanacetum coccineum]
MSTTIGDENHIRTLGDYSKPIHEGYRNSIELPAGNNVVPLRFDTIRLVQNGCSFHGLRFKDPNQHLKDFLKSMDSLDLDSANKFHRYMGGSYCPIPCSILSTGKDHKTPQRYPDDLALYDNESWNDPRDFAKPVKAITLPQDVLSTSGHRLIELENQVQRLTEAHLAPTEPTQVNKINTSCEICSGPHDTEYCIKNPEQAFVDYASSRANEMGEEEDVLSTNACSLDLGGMIKGREGVKEQGKEENEMGTDMEVDEVIKEEESKFKTSEEVKEILEDEEDDKDGENFNLFPTIEELTHHEWLSKNPRPSWVTFDEKKLGSS